MVQIIKGDKIVSKSSNLRGILRYASKHGVFSTVLTRAPESVKGELMVSFQNGAYAIAQFEDHSVLTEWVAKRGWPVI